MTHMSRVDHALIPKVNLLKYVPDVQPTAEDARRVGWFVVCSD